MELVGRLLAVAPRDEEVPPVAVLEELARVLLAGQRDGGRPGDPRRQRAEHEHALVLLRDAVDDLAGEVGEHRLGRGEAAVVGPRRGPRRVLAHEDQPRGPAVGPPVDGVERVGRELPVRPEEARRLVAREAQLLGADAGDRLVRHQPRELRCGGSGRLITMTLTPTGISSSPVANAARASVEPPASWRLSSTSTLPAGMRAKSSRNQRRAKPFRSRRYSSVKSGSRRGLLPAEAAAGEAEVVEERRRIGVARVDVVPDRVELPRLEVARDEHRLAAAGRARQPDDRMLATLVEQPEEALARTDAIDAGTREFGELGCRGHCGGARKRPILAVPGDLPCAVTLATTGGSRGRRNRAGADARRSRTSPSARARLPAAAGRARSVSASRPATRDVAQHAIRCGLGRDPRRARRRNRSAKRRRRKTLRRTRCSTARRSSRRPPSLRVNAA